MEWYLEKWDFWIEKIMDEFDLDNPRVAEKILMDRIETEGDSFLVD